MTAKETRYVRKLEIQIEQLEATLKRSRGTWGEQFTENYRTRTALLQSYEAIEEAAAIIRNCTGHEPIFPSDVQHG